MMGSGRPLPPPQPPPPKLPPPDVVLTDDELDALPPGQLVDMTRELLERTLGFPVVNFPGPYVEAFTHKSVSAYYHRSSYERMEFLGDSIVNFVVAKFLFDAFPHEQEGEMTKIRTRITRSETLAYLATQLQLDRFVFMSGKGLYRGWNQNKRIMEDVMEALVAAVYLDQGLAAAKNFFVGLIHTHIDMNDMMKDRNFKDNLMRTAHARGLPLPVYESEQRIESHDDKRWKVFYVTAALDGHVGYGKGRTKKEAEQAAARDALVKLGIPLDE